MVVKKNADKYRRIYERSLMPDMTHDKLGQLFGMSRANIGYIIRQYKKLNKITDDQNK